MSQSRANRTRDEPQSISNADLQEATKECVRFILCKEGSKIPIKRSDINNHLKTICPTTAYQLKTILNSANTILQNVYGYKLLQVDAQYLVVLNEPCDSLLSSVVDTRHRRILIAVLMHIYMNGAPVKEDDMWRFLTDAGLLDYNKESKATRDLVKVHFTRQMYLNYSKIGDGEFARHVFQWGHRAKAEVPKLFLLKKLAEAFGKTPDHWCEQYKEAMEEVQT